MKCGFNYDIGSDIIDYSKEKTIKLYAIRNKRTKELVNRKCKDANPFYSSWKRAENKRYDDSEEVVTYTLIENK